jgi:DNA-binding Xre family transcriptional regulator
VSASYKKLWILLSDKDLLKKDLRRITGISSASMAKLAKNQNVTTDVLVRICDALECDFADIMERVADDSCGNANSQQK